MRLNAWTRDWLITAVSLSNTLIVHPLVSGGACCGVLPQLKAPGRYAVTASAKRQLPTCAGHIDLVHETVWRAPWPSVVNLAARQEGVLAKPAGAGRRSGLTVRGDLILPLRSRPPERAGPVPSQCFGREHFDVTEGVWLRIALLVVMQSLNQALRPIPAALIRRCEST